MVTLLGSCWLISARPSTELIIIYYFRNYWTAMSLNAFCHGFFLICLSDSREPVLKVKHQAGSISMVPCLRVLCWGHWPFWFKLTTWLQGAWHKYVDDTTMTEILISVTSASQMQSFLCTLTDWTLENDMWINTSKTKELVIGPWTTLPYFKLNQELSSASATSNCWKYMSTQLCLGQNMLSMLHRRRLRGTISWKYLKERAYPRITCCIIMLRSSDLSWSTALVSGITILPTNSPCTLKLSRNEL